MVIPNQRIFCYIVFFQPQQQQFSPINIIQPFDQPDSDSESESGPSTPPTFAFPQNPNRLTKTAITRTTTAAVASQEGRGAGVTTGTTTPIPGYPDTNFRIPSLASSSTPQSTSNQHSGSVHGLDTSFLLILQQKRNSWTRNLNRVSALIAT